MGMDGVRCWWAVTSSIRPKVVCSWKSPLYSVPEGHKLRLTREKGIGVSLSDANSYGQDKGEKHIIAYQVIKSFVVYLFCLLFILIESGHFLTPPTLKSIGI